MLSSKDRRKWAIEQAIKFATPAIAVQTVSTGLLFEIADQIDYYVETGKQEIPDHLR